MDKDSSVLDRQFSGMSMRDLVGEVLEEINQTINSYGGPEALSERQMQILETQLAKSIVEYLSEIDDDYVARLEEENEEMREEIQNLNSTGYSELKNDIRWKEALIAALMYLYSDGEPLELKTGRLEEMHDVDVGFVEKDEDTVRIIVDEE